MRSFFEQRGVEVDEFSQLNSGFARLCRYRGIYTEGLARKLNGLAELFLTLGFGRPHQPNVVRGAGFR